LELFQYVASQVWEEKTGRGMKEFPREKLGHADSPAGEALSEESEEGFCEDLKRRFPRLWEKFWPGDA